MTMHPHSSAEQLAGELEPQLALASSIARQQLQQLPASSLIPMQGLIRKPQNEAHQDFASNIAEGLTMMDEQLPDNPSLHNRLHAFFAGSMAMAKLVDLVKVKTLGQKAPASISNALIGKMLDASGFKFVGTHYDAYDDEAAHDTEQFGQAASVLIKQESKYVWFAPKVALLSHAIRNARNLFRWADETSEGAQPAEIEQQRSANDELFALTKGIQRYGVKSAIAPAVGDHPIQEWLFIPVDEFLADPDTGSTSQHRMNSGLGFMTKDCEAIILGAPAQFKTSKPKPYQQATADRQAKLVGYEMSELIGSAAGETPQTMTLMLTKTGHLVSTHGVDLRDVFEAHGASEAYETLRSEMLAIYFDLVTPALIHKVVDQEINGPSGPGDPENDTMTRMGKLRRLILARQHVLETLGDDVNDLFDQEAQQHKDIVVHGVINHIRDLPEGYRASQEVRDRCFRETGIILPEFGQTYVRKHERGNIEEIEPKGHRTVHRNRGVVAARRASGSGRTTPKGTQNNGRRRKAS